jgi:hypothetical protein
MAAPSAPPPLASLRAGRVAHAPEGSNGLRLTPDARRGELRLVRDSGLATLVWRDRTTGASEEVFTVFPNDITVRRVRSPADADRVYEVAFAQHADRRAFFWLQGGDPARDADAVAALLHAVNNPDAAARGECCRGEEGLAALGVARRLLPRALVPTVSQRFPHTTSPIPQTHPPSHPLQAAPAGRAAPARAPWAASRPRSCRR